jgi:HSP20 family protein
MNMRDLMPRSQNGNAPVPASYRDLERNPLLTLHREMNRLFDDMWRGFDAPMPVLGRASAWESAWPSVEIADTGKEVKVTADLPGLDETDVDVTLENGVLTLSGEKRAETDDKERQFSERYYGRFERQIPLGIEVEEDKVAASFRNGVLTVTLPKSATAQTRTRHIAINGKTH